MSVYVDNMNARFRGMVMCHMGADTLDELHEMADKIGLQRQWFQDKSIPHYDVSLSKKRFAIENGATAVSTRVFVQLLRSQK